MPQRKGKTKKRTTQPTQQKSERSKKPQRPIQEHSSFRQALGRIESSSSLLNNPDTYNEVVNSLQAALPKNFDSMTESERRDILQELRLMVKNLPDYIGNYVKQVGQSFLDTLDPELKEIRSEINRLQNQEPEPTPEELAQELKQLFGNTISRLDSKDRDAVVTRLRDTIDHLPLFYREKLVNQAHKALNPFDKQIGIPGATYLGPSRVPHSSLTGKDDEYEHISNRGIQQLVRINGELYTPVYMSVVADSSTDKLKPQYKDFTQNKDGIVEIHTGGSKSEEGTLWVSFGRPLRQVKWLEVYGYKSQADPLLRSFLLPARIANYISAKTVTEYNTSGIDADINVDKHYERNQLGIRSPESLELLRQFALPGSLRTYYTGAKKPEPLKAWGDARHIDEMLEHLGIPNQQLREMPIFTNPQDKSFVSQKNYKQQADDLNRMYAYYMNNPNLLPSNESGRQEAMPWFFYRWYDSYQFHRRYNPDIQNISMEQFFDQYVAPWATQAQIAQLVAEDYEELAKTPEEIPDKPSEIIYNVDSGTTKTGERRSSVVALSNQVQQILNDRFQFLESIGEAQKEINKLFANKTVQGSSFRAALGKLSKVINDINDDYRFRIGDTEKVNDMLSKYRDRVKQHLEELKKQKPADDTLTGIINSLDRAMLPPNSPLFSL